MEAAYSVAGALKLFLHYLCFTVCLMIYWLSAVVLVVCLVDGLLFNKYTFSYTVVLLLHLFFVTKFAPEFDSREKENIFYRSLHAISSVIYWLSAAILGLCLVWLLLTVEYTFIHIVVLLLLLSLVLSFICIIIMIPINFFYDREIKNPFSDYMKIAVPEEEIMTCVEQFNYCLNALLHLLTFSNTQYSLVFGVVLLLLSFVTNYLNISLFITLCVILRLLLIIPPLQVWYCQLKETSCGEQETVSSSVAKGNFLKSLCFIVHYVIYCRDYSLNEMILGLCLVWLLLTVKYTFIHIVVLLLLLSLVFFFICIIIKIAVDLLYNREIKLLFSNYRWLKIALPKDEVKMYLVRKLNYVLNKLACLLFFDDIKASLLFGVVLLLLSLVTNYLNISTLIFLCVILLFYISPLYAWYWKIPNTLATASSHEFLDMIKEVLNHMRRISCELSAELKDLINELQEVTDWYLLGLCLGLSESRLQEINQDHWTNDERRRGVLATWARQENPTWSKVVRALREMGGHQVLTSQIAEIYGVRQSRSAEKTSSQTREVQSPTGEEQQMLLTSVQKPQMGLKDLLKELQQVTEWHKLGLYLDVPEHKLDDIEAERNYGNTDDCRREMLIVWMKSEVATWARVVHALIHIDQRVLAANIASKYGVPIPKSVIEKTQPQSPPTSMEQETPIQPDAASEQTLVQEYQDGHHFELKDVPMKDLRSELQEVTDWFTLGVYLDVPTPLLVAIRNDYTDTDQCRVEMLITWSKQEMPTWPRVVHALGEMEMTKLAIALAEKYAVPPSLHKALKQKAESARMQVTPGRNDGQEEEEALRILVYYEGDIRSAKELLDELQEVTDWMPFGLCLGLDVSTLKQIQKDQLTTDRCRREVLLTWGKEQTPIWLKVIQALVKIRMFHLAVKIASKYGVTVTKSLYNEMKVAVPEDKLRCVEKSDGREEMAKQPNTSVDGDANLQDLVNELQEVTDWFQLGLCLNVPLSVLRTIQQDSKEDTNKCREEMLKTWMKREVPMWSTIVKALVDMKMADLALKIASKHFTSRTDEEGDGGDGGDGGEGRRRQGKRSEERERSRKGNSMPLSAVFGALLCIGLLIPSEIKISPKVINCGLLNEPQNGYVSLSGTGEGDTATYSCKPGFVLELEEENTNTRVCSHSGKWTGSAPECWRVDCSTPKQPNHGTVNYDGTGYNMVVSYKCDEGYSLIGPSARVCQSNGKWSGEEPFCEPIQPTTPLHYTEASSHASILKKFFFFLAFCSLYLCCYCYLIALLVTQEANGATAGWCILIYTFSFILLIYWCTSFLFSFLFVVFFFSSLCLLGCLMQRDS